VKTFLKALLGVWMVLVIIGAFTFVPPARGFQVPALARIMIFHVPQAMTATLASLLSGVFALRYLMRRKIIEDMRANAAAMIALLFWVLTTVTGAVFAKVEWGAYWNWDPKQECIFVLLLIYFAYFALRSAIGDVHKRAAVCAGYTLFAAVSVPFLTYVLPNAPGIQTNHPSGVVFSMDGMDSKYKLVFWSATIGFAALAWWIYRLSVQIDVLTSAAMARLRRTGAAG
jgi:heme exporter protein C